MMGKKGKEGKVTERALLKLRSVGKIGMLTFSQKNSWGGMMGKIGEKGKVTENINTVI